MNHHGIPTHTILGHEEFLQQYVLARALAHTGGLEGSGAASQAQIAWERIQATIQATPKTENKSPNT